MSDLKESTRAPDDVNVNVHDAEREMEHYRRISEQVKQEWNDEAIEAATRGLSATPKSAAFRGPLVALVVFLVIAIVLVILFATVDDFPTVAFVLLLVAALLVPCALVCVHKGPGQPESTVQKSLPVPDAPVVEGESRPYRNTRVETLKTSMFGETTLRELFERSATKHPARPCMLWRDVRSVYHEDTVSVDPVSGESKTIRAKRVVLSPEFNVLTYKQAQAKVNAIGAGLVSLGLERNDRVAIYASTSKDWQLCAQACLANTLPVVTVYATLGDAALCYALHLTETSVVVADAELLRKLADVVQGRTIQDGADDREVDIRSVRTIITIGEPDEAAAQPLRERAEDLGGAVRVLSLDELIANGGNRDSQPAPQERAPTPEDLAVIMFTSGSTGLPKGVEITHQNLVGAVSGMAGSLPRLNTDDVYLGYLPLAHVLELAAETCMFAVGASVGYGSPFTLSDASPWHPPGSGQRGDAPTLCPTVLAAVPRIMDKIRANIFAKVDKAGGLKAKLFHMAYERKRAALDEGRRTPFWDGLVFDKLRTQVLGGRVRMMLSGGGPLSEDTQKFMNIVFCCPVGQGYGLTETCGGGTIVWSNDRSVGRVGPPVLCSDIKLVDWAEGNYFSTPRVPGAMPAGEICISGPNVTRGYYQMPEKTAEDFRVDEHGRRWFHTGDIGCVHPDGVIQIIDRKKDLVKLSHGEYVSLGKVESRMRDAALIDNICVYADSKESYCVALVTLNPATLDTLGAAGEGGVAAAAARPEVNAAVLRQIKAIGKESRFASFEVPKKVHICAEEWTPETDMVTTAFKLRRRNIQERYARELDAMYGKVSSAAAPAE